jgi:hypothetical protein
MRMWLTSFSDHHWAMGSVYKIMIKSDLEVNVSTGKDSNNCWIVLDLVHMNKVKGRDPLNRGAAKNSFVKLQMNNI